MNLRLLEDMIKDGQFKNIDDVIEECRTRFKSKSVYYGIYIDDLTYNEMISLSFSGNNLKFKASYLK